MYCAFRLSSADSGACRAVCQFVYIPLMQGVCRVNVTPRMALLEGPVLCNFNIHQIMGRYTGDPCKGFLTLGRQTVIKRGSSETGEMSQAAGPGNRLTSHAAKESGGRRVFSVVGFATSQRRREVGFLVNNVKTWPIRPQRGKRGTVNERMETSTLSQFVTRPAGSLTVRSMRDNKLDSRRLPSPSDSHQKTD